MMYKLLIILLLLGTAPLTYAQHEHHKPAQQQQTEIYTCPMHPEVQSTKPGKCPKCGMTLIKQTSKKPAKQEQAPAKKALKAKPATPSKKPVQYKQAQPTQKKAQSAPKHPQASQEKTETPLQNPVEKEKSIHEAGHKPESKGPTYNPRTVRYDLYVRDTLVNFTGKTRRAVAINGSIPAPVLTFTQGDTAEIYVHNEMDVETTIHWHGVFLPNRFDGVPWLTQKPIKPHTTYLYKFPILQNGTYWYHSHSGFQEQSGMYGALIFNKVNEPDMPAIPIVLSDWTDMNPKEVYRSLRSAND